MALGELLIVTVNIHIQCRQLRRHIIHMQALDAHRSVGILHAIIIGPHLPPIPIRSGNIGKEIGDSFVERDMVMREKTWAAIF